jgi:LacI family transcriptional regulator
VIGILVAEFEPFSAEILKGAASALSDTGYELLAYTGGLQGRGAGWERRYLSRLSGTLIDGAVLVTPTVVEADAGVPVVAIDPHTGPTGLPTVDSDNLVGAVLGTEHLLGLGHRRIGFVGGRADLESSRLREQGFRQAMAAAGLPVDEALVRAGDYRKESTLEPARELLSRSDRPSAIFAANDLSAIATIEVARDLGLSVPGDLSVIGFDDIPESAQIDPPLTTVHQPIQQMGAAAIEMLTALLDGSPVDEPHVRLPTSLVQRRTTAPPR